MVSAPAAPNAPPSSTTPTTTPAISQAVIDALTVTTTSVDCLEVVNNNGGSTQATINGQTIVSFNGHIGALMGTPPRKWSDALSTPYVQSDPSQMLAETQATICEDPLYGSTVGNLFANMMVGSAKVLDLNSWLQPFAGDPATTISTTAAGFIPLLGIPKAQQTAAQQQASITQNLA